MCRICNDLLTEMRLIRKELREMPCGQEKLKHPERKGYWQTYYQKNRAKKAEYYQQRKQETNARRRATSGG